MNDRFGAHNYITLKNAYIAQYSYFSISYKIQKKKKNPCLRQTVIILLLVVIKGREIISRMLLVTFLLCNLQPMANGTPTIRV